MAKWSDEKMADLTRRLADTAIDYKTRCEVLEERWEAACQDAREAEAHAEELAAKLAKAVEAAFYEGFYEGNEGGRVSPAWKQSDALAELKGGKNE